MIRRGIPAFGGDSDTEIKILDAATELFTLNGFDAVSMNDIAKAVGIKTASIYYYFDGKKALGKVVMSRFEATYKKYFEWLSGINSEAVSLDELMDNMFNEEFLNMLNLVACFGMSLALREQHSNENARRCVFELFYNDGIKLLQEGFDRLIEKHVIPQSDTKTLATLFMFSVLCGNDIRIHEYVGIKAPIDCKDLYSGLRKILAAALTQGNIKANTGE